MTRASRSVISPAQPVAHRARLRTGRGGDLAIAQMSGVVNAISFHGERTHTQILARPQNSVENPSPRSVGKGSWSRLA